MKIESMTATFGKLDHETITFRDGLNVITAGNEWGKSTWCAFLLAMLYGVDTRAKSTKTALAAKERYTPWSGSPMAGSMTVLWQGRRVTLERTTRGRIPMGEFRAYETETGLEVAELTAENCGLVLLGAEREVFCRAGFLRQEDMPVTQNDALRARLNALVTTGDDSGDAARLAQTLKELKNKCAYRKTGLLPQAQDRQRELEAKLRQLDTLEEELQSLQERQSLTKADLDALRNHRAALDYAKAESDARQVEQARREAERCRREQEDMEAFCAQLPTRQEAEDRLKALAAHRNAWSEAEAERGRCAAPPSPPETQEAFRGLTADQALQRAESDGKIYRAMGGRGFWACAGAALLAAGLGAWLLLMLRQTIPALAAFGVSALLLAASLLVGGREKDRQKALAALYGGGTPEQWMAKARTYGDALREYDGQMQQWQHRNLELEQQLQGLKDQREYLCEGRDPQEMAELCRQVRQSFDRLDGLRAQAAQAKAYLMRLEAMAAQAPEAEEDSLSLSPQETEQALLETERRLAELHGQLGAARERLETIGSRQTLERALEEAAGRTATLQKYDAALELARQTLEETTRALQRRFAPQISARAQELIRALTGARYDRLLLMENFELLTGAAGEDTLRQALWRSDGTVDQLYLALRLAVAQTVMPEAPLILDDALVRFDDDRMGSALKVLGDYGAEKQVILFTCQQREQQWLGKNKAAR